MAAIITGKCGTVAFWDGQFALNKTRAFGAKGDFHKPDLCSFASLSAFAANGNHAPADFDGAVTWDAGIGLLFKIAGAR